MTLQMKMDERYDTGIEIGTKNGKEQGKNDLYNVIMYIKAGKTEEELLNEGFTVDDIEMAKKVLK